MSATQSYGVTPQGYVPKSQQQIILEANASLQATFGANINLSAESNFGQIVGIFSEREALLWALGEAIYASQYPAGAEGTSVDNILALSNLTRLPASPTVTNPSPTLENNGLTLAGLVLQGTAGTVIPAGSTILSATSPQLSFTLNNAVTIGSAVNAQQVILTSNIPSSGSYQLGLVDATGALLTTQAIPFNALPTQTQLTWTTAPTSGTFALMLGGNLVPTLPFNATAGALQSALVSLGGVYGGATVSGSVAAGFVISWATGFNPRPSLLNSLLSFATTPTGGTFALTVAGSVTTALLPYNATAAQLQAALVALGYPRVKAALASTSPLGFALNWIGMSAPPTLTVASNTTGVALSVGSTMGLNQTPTAVDSVQAAINATYNAATAMRPFTDVGLSGAFSAMTVAFGAFAPQTGEPASGAAAQQTLTVLANSLSQASAITNVSVSQAAVGSPAQAVGNATCTANGPNSVLAGQLNQIGSPISGWTAVTNPLDCLLGSNVETDTQALSRRTALLAAQANGPLQSIADKVAQVAGVTSVSKFQNTTDAALQVLTFASVPTSGSYALLLPTGMTAALAYNATALTLQNALRALPNYTAVKLTGSVAQGFTLDFNGALGGQPQGLVQVVNNTTGVGITVAFGRPPKSFEIVVQGGAVAAIGQAIFASQPAGIASYGTPAAVTLAAVTFNAVTLSVASATNIAVGQSAYGLGIPTGATVVAVNGTTVTLSLVALGTYASTPVTFSWTATVSDASGNLHLVNFSRPVEVLIYVNINLLTDQYVVPGSIASGVNVQSQFNPLSIPAIQAAIVALGNAVPSGGLVVGQGTQGLVGAFNNVPGIVGYTLTFDTVPMPTNSANIQLLPLQEPLFESFNVAVSYQ